MLSGAASFGMSPRFLGTSYSYDASRTVGGTSYTLTYDVENRLTGVSGGASATVGNSVAATYDGDGNRVKGVAGAGRPQSGGPAPFLLPRASACTIAPDRSGEGKWSIAFWAKLASSSRR